MCRLQCHTDLVFILIVLFNMLFSKAVSNLSIIWDRLINNNVSFIEIYLLSARQYVNCYYYIPSLIWSSQQLREGDIRKTKANWFKQLAQGYLLTSRCLFLFLLHLTLFPLLQWRKGLFLQSPVGSLCLEPIPSCLPDIFFHVIILLPSTKSFLSAYKLSMESPKLNSLPQHHIPASPHFSFLFIQYISKDAHSLCCFSSFVQNTRKLQIAKSMDLSHL